MTTRDATFLRILGDKEKGTFLRSATRNENDPRRYSVEQSKFSLIPGSPLAYWVGETIRDLFVRLPRFESGDRTARQGLATADDFRFVRLWWEVPTDDILDGRNGPWQTGGVKEFQAWCRERTKMKRWVPFAKGGSYSPYYVDLHLVVNWADDGSEIRNFVNPKTGRSYSRPQNTDYYFRSGMTWFGRTASGYGPRILPFGSIFSHRGLSAFDDAGSGVWLTTAIHLTRAYALFLELIIGLGEEAVSGSAARDYTSGAIGKLPDLTGMDGRLLAARDSVRTLLSWWMLNHRTVENSWFYGGLADISNEELRNRAKTALNAAGEIEEATRDVLGFGPNEVMMIIDAVGPNPELDMAHCGEEQLASVRDLARQSTEDLIRLGVKRGLASRSVTKNMHFVDRRVEVIAQISGCKASFVVEVPETLVSDLTRGPQLSDEISFSIGVSFERFKGDAEPNLDWDDPITESTKPYPAVPPAMIGESNGASGPTIIQGADLEQAVQDYLRSESPIRHARRYDLDEKAVSDFISGGDFFSHHLSLYSASRRKAPVYWPLSTPSGSYILWVYYPRLTDQTLNSCIADFIDPKLEQDVRPEIDRLRRKQDLSGADRKQLDTLVDLERELTDMRSELERVTKLPYKPNLNDGVIICAAPLWKLFQHKGWQKDLKQCWKDLESGKYEWAHLAYGIWPDRVQDKCRTDKSIAIAHGLQHLYKG